MNGAGRSGRLCGPMRPQHPDNEGRALLPGRVDRAGRPVTFWLLVFSMTVLGLSILGVAWEWPIVGTLGRLVGPR